MNYLISKIKKILALCNIAIVRNRKLIKLESYQNEIQELFISKGNLGDIAALLNKSKSQNWQDIFCITEHNFKANGYFVEFGATNGVDISNTYLLEKEYGWTGLLAEPAKIWHESLRRNRKCNIDTSCVYSKTGKLMQFNEVRGSEELSTLDKYSLKDAFSKKRKLNAIKYDVKTISLSDLLDKYNAPKIIEYLSIDTEGSEYEILSKFDFNKYKFEVITCEHNYTINQEKIYTLLTKNGYKRKYIGLSKADDWYVLA